MKKLNLKKKSEGKYFAKISKVSILIENPFICVGMGPNEWQLYIHIKGKIICIAFFPTREKANLYAANWINENL